MSVDADLIQLLGRYDEKQVKEALGIIRKAKTRSVREFSITFNEKLEFSYSCKAEKGPDREWEIPRFSVQAFGKYIHVGGKVLVKGGKKVHKAQGRISAELVTIKEYDKSKRRGAEGE
jgi:hypothetical protein